MTPCQPMHNEHEELVKLAVELRDILFDDANDMMQGAMVGCPVECVAFAKWWIQRAKGISFDDPLDACAFRGSNVQIEGQPASGLSRSNAGLGSD